MNAFSESDLIKNAMCANLLIKRNAIIQKYPIYLYALHMLISRAIY